MGEILEKSKAQYKASEVVTVVAVLYNGATKTLYLRCGVTPADAWQREESHPPPDCFPNVFDRTTSLESVSRGGSVLDHNHTSATRCTITPPASAPPVTASGHGVAMQHATGVSKALARGKAGRRGEM